MNNKIKNYVNVLFNDIPNTPKSAELKEEILSNMNEHFEEHIREGKSENQAYTEAISDLGDIDELLKSITPNTDETERINEYRKKRATFTSLGVSLYILGAVFLCGLPAISEVFNIGKTDGLAVIGFIIMLLCAAVATGMIVYIRMSIPQDIEPYIISKKHNEGNYNMDTTSGRIFASVMKIYWTIVLVVYFAVSFGTGAWHITWLIFLIGGALRQALTMFFTGKDE